MKRFRSWYRVVSPPEWVVGLIVAGLAAAELLIALIRQQFGDPPFQWESELCGYAALLLAMLWGLWRVTAFHPVFQLQYRDWLERSPWKHGQPLPLGPPHFVLQDWVLLAVLIVLTLRHPVAGPEDTVAFMLLPWVAGITLTLFITGELGLAWMLSFGVVGVFRLVYIEYAPAVAAVVLYLLAAWGLRRSLKRFATWELAWLDAPEIRNVFSSGDGLQDFLRGKMHGWPFDQLAPRRFPLPIGMRLGLQLGLLAGWVVYCGLFALSQGRQIDMGAYFMNFFAVTAFAGLRLVLYTRNFYPPINLWGRLRTFRWVIPSYDVVFLAPLTVAVVGLIGPWMLSQLEIHPNHGIPGCIGLMLFVALTMGPEADRWRLTGNHRIVPGLSSQKNEYVEV